MVVAGQLTGYRLLTEPSSDGLLAVSHAVRESDGVEVTMCLVVADLDRTQSRRVRDETAALDATLAISNNPFILPLLDHGKDSEGRPFFVTAKRGRSLADELAARGPLPYGEACGPVLEAATGLELLHRQGMLHQRIGPAALLRLPTGRVIVDCPLVPVLAELTTSITEGTGHEPPEVLSGQDWSPRGEVYALASTFWTLIDGRPLFPGSRAERLLAMLGGQVPRLQPPDAPGSAVDVLQQALAGEPGSRPESMAAFARALQHGQDPVPQHASIDEQTLLPPGGKLTLGSDYELLSPIGAGASGTVWRARRRVDNVMVAAKVLHRELVSDPDNLIRLVRESSSVHDLVHPHLVRVHDLYIDRGRGEAAVIMDLVDGPDMRRLLKDDQLGRAEGMRLLSEVASGLAAVHAKGVVHRDLKPDNILVRDLAGRRTALLTDFGLAKTIDHPTVTRTGYVPGTPAYLAPELTNGESHSPASDVYALGVTTYEVLARRRPFTGSTEEVLRRHRFERAARPAGLPDAAWRFLEACLAKQPGFRPSAADAADILSDLAREVALAGPEVITEDDGRTVVVAPHLPIEVDDAKPSDTPPTGTGSGRPPGPTRRRPRRRWWILGGALAVSVAGSAIGVWLAQSTSDTSAHPSEPPAAQYQVTAQVTADSSGGVTVRWSGQNAALPGLARYFVFRNGVFVGEANKNVVTYQDLAADGTGCYQVIAFGVSAPPPVPPPPAACVPHR